MMSPVCFITNDFNKRAGETVLFLQTKDLLLCVSHEGWNILYMLINISFYFKLAKLKQYKKQIADNQNTKILSTQLSTQHIYWKW